MCAPVFFRFKDVDEFPYLVRHCASIDSDVIGFWFPHNLSDGLICPEIPTRLNSEEPEFILEAQFGSGLIIFNRENIGIRYYWMDYN